MKRISITFSQSNDEWLKEQVKKGEFLSKTEAVNHIVRLARAAQAEDTQIREALAAARLSGRETRSLDQIEADVMAEMGVSDAA